MFTFPNIIKKLIQYNRTNYTYITSLEVGQKLLKINF